MRMLYIFCYSAHFHSLIWYSLNYFLPKRSSVSFISKIRPENKDQSVIAPKIAV